MLFAKLLFLLTNFLKLLLSCTAFLLKQSLLSQQLLHDPLSHYNLFLP